ncbi:MAG: hypothetical protein NZM42_12250 [Gemmatales bacterium]|nr:hypothetical protein [Gemmatales bacterium]MDW8223556.1 hypothetical protein [Gemmatales bacterium]
MDLAHPKQLTAPSVQETHLTYRGMEELAQLKELVLLNLDGMQITNAGLRSWLN